MVAGKLTMVMELWPKTARKTFARRGGAMDGQRLCQVLVVTNDIYPAKLKVEQDASKCNMLSREEERPMRCHNKVQQK